MLKYLAAIIFVFGLAVYIAVQDERAAQQAAQETAQSNKIAPTAEPDKNHPQENIPKPKRDAPRWFRFFRWGDSFTIWAIVLTLLAIAEQTNETKRATDSQREKDRARLIFVTFRDNESLGNDFTFNPYWSISILMKQHGPTKAFNVRGKGALVIKRADEPRPTVSRKKMTLLHDVPSIVEGSDGDSVMIEPALGFVAIGEDEMAGISSEELRAHFFGFVEYDDVFGAKHTTRFRYVWQPEVREPVPNVPGETFQIESAGWRISSGKKKDNHAD